MDPIEETTETVEETNPAENEAPAASEGEGNPAPEGEGVVESEQKPDPGVAEKLAKLKEEADKKAAAAPAEGEKPAADAGAQKEFKPNFEVEVLGQKLEIPKHLQKYMKDAESEKEIRDLFTHAKGVDFIKGKNAELVQKNTEVTHENTAIKQTIDELRGIYQGAVRTGNWHRLDTFFEKMQIPTMHILQYAMEKAKLAELPPDQRQVVEAQIDADRRAEMLASQQAGTQAQNLSMAQQIKQLQIQTTLLEPEVVAMKSEFETRTGKPGSFEAMMRQYGELAWHQSQGRVNLTPRQVIDLMAKDFGLTGKVQENAPAATPAAAAATTGTSQSAVPGKPVVHRTNQTIPNVQGKSGSSPLKSKPRSIEDLQKRYKEMVAADEGA